VGFLWHGDRNIGGGEHATFLLAGQLSPEYTPVLLYAKHNHLVDQFEKRGVKLIRIPLDPRITSMYRDEVRFTLSHLRDVWSYLTAVSHVVGVLRQERITILNPVDNLSKLIGGVAGRIAGVKLVAHCHDDLDRSLVDTFLKFYQLLFMHRIIAVSNTIAQRFVLGNQVPAKVQTIFNSVNLSEFSRGAVPLAGDVDWQWTRGRVVLAIVAIFDRAKGHTHLFRALSYLSGLGDDDWCCLVVGEGREQDVLERKISFLNLTDSVRLIGYRTDMPMVLRGVDIVVLPSERESFGRIAIEAMAMAIPVIASNVGGIPEVVVDGRTGLLVPASDFETLALAIRKLVHDQPLRREMGLSGRTRVAKHFSLQDNIAQTKMLYDSLSNTSPRAE
jgi:glycosyltransferase involved in cell wall biosynthesis